MYPKSSDITVTPSTILKNTSVGLQVPFYETEHSVIVEHTPPDLESSLELKILDFQSVYRTPSKIQHIKDEFKIGANALKSSEGVEKLSAVVTKLYNTIKP